MDGKPTILIHDTESFMRGELDNVTVADGRIRLDVVQGAHVPYGCYTSAAFPLPAFDALRMSWNALTPAGTAVEAQARVMLDGNWSAWVSFGRWGTRMRREGAEPRQRGPLVVTPDALLLDSKLGSQVQLRIYLYTKDEQVTPTVHLLGASVRAVDVIPAGGRPVNARLRLMPYAMARRAPARRDVMDLAICVASLTNRWGADLLPEEVAQVLRDYRPQDDYDRRNLCFAAAAAGCWGFPAWVCWTDLAGLRAEVRAGYGAVVMLESTPAQLAAGLPALRCAALRGFAMVDGESRALLCDPWAADTDFETETSLPLDEFLVAWNNTALLMRKREDRLPKDRPARRGDLWLRPQDEEVPRLYVGYLNGEAALLPDDFCEQGGILAWATPDERPHATTGHRTLRFTTPEQGGIRLPQSDGHDQKCTVYAIDPTGSMMVGDVTV